MKSWLSYKRGGAVERWSYIATKFQLPSEKHYITVNFALTNFMLFSFRQVLLRRLSTTEVKKKLTNDFVLAAVNHERESRRLNTKP